MTVPLESPDHPLHSFQHQDNPPDEVRRRLGTKGQLALALLPTCTVLAMLALIEHLGHQRLLFAPLASSAFLIYLDPHHGANRTRALAGSQFLASLIGMGAQHIFGAGYSAAAGAMIVTIVALVTLDMVHPPAVSTTLTFAFRNAAENEFALFGIAVLMVVVLVALQRASVWLLSRSLARLEPAT